MQELTFEEVYEQYKHLIPTTLGRMFPNPRNFANSKQLEYQDLIQYGNLGLFNAWKNYKPETGMSFRNFVITSIRWTVNRQIRNDSNYLKIWKMKEDSDENTVRALSMSSSPQNFENGIDDLTYYELIARDNINTFDANENSPEHKALSALTIEKVLNMLKGKDREILKLKLEDSMSDSEIGKIIGISKQAVNVRYKKIKEKLADIVHMEVVGV